MTSKHSPREKSRSPGPRGGRPLSEEIILGPPEFVPISDKQRLALVAALAELLACWFEDRGSSEEAA
jgi:hypothetical protein